MDQSNLVFIISQPRAGSTLLQKILDSHSKVCSPPEPWLMLPLSLIRNNNYNVNYCSNHSSSAINQLLKRLPNGNQVYKKAVREFTFSIYGEFLKANGATLFVDKTPRYYYILDYLSNMFPEAKFVVLLRHPLDSFVSLRDTFCNNSDGAALERSGDSILGAQKIAEFLNKPMKHRKVVQYEKLVQNPNVVISDLCAFLGLDFEPAMINYGKFKHGNGFGDPKINKSAKPHKNSINKWKTKLKPAVAKEVVKRIGPGVIKKLGYNVNL